MNNSPPNLTGQKTKRLHTGMFYQKDQKTKKCTICKVEKNKSEFHVRRKKSNHDLCYYHYAARCKECASNYNKATKSTTKSYRKNKETLSVKRKEKSDKNKHDIDYNILKRMKDYERRSKEHGRPFNLTVEYLKELLYKQNLKCFYSGRPMILWSSGRPDRSSMSLDRIDSNEGYVMGNVVWCCNNVNIMKKDMTQEEFYSWIRDINSRIPEAAVPLQTNRLAQTAYSPPNVST